MDNAVAPPPATAPQGASRSGRLRTFGLLACSSAPQLRVSRVHHHLGSGRWTDYDDATQEGDDSENWRSSWQQYRECGGP